MADHVSAAGATRSFGSIKHLLGYGLIAGVGLVIAIGVHVKSARDYAAALERYRAAQTV